MAWSTRELAELAGTTVKAVRHYHELGLLDEPERLSNGYKQYQVVHLVRLLQITRLAGLGVPLAQIAAMDRADQDPDDALRILDTELATTIERLQRIRAELALIRRDHASPEMPLGFSRRDLTSADRALVMIYSRVFDETAMTQLQAMMNGVTSTPAELEFEALPADSDRATRRALAERIAPEIGRMQEQFPWLKDPGAHATKGEAFAQRTVGQALRDLYNPAQLEVLYRADLVNRKSVDDLAALDAALDAAEEREARLRRGSRS
jgi:DNA-binding transcriptional MerR regulator